ncbi:MAG: hypothetical protein HYZ93_02290, partial [Candidatus Omnitrophica bacterium]|nr:hypothetical protein [Candidatus Omnitrophota bacterium]
MKNSILTRLVAGLTASTFTLLQLFTSIPVALAQEERLPHWLRQEEGGWVPAEQAQRMQRADQELLQHLSTLEQAQQRFITTHPSGLQAQYAAGEMVVARDSQGDLLWAPTVDDYRRIQNGTLLLADGTLQVVRNGRLSRQVAVDGSEAVYRADGRVDHETAPDGIRTDYSYQMASDGTLQGFSRTTHLPNGDLTQQYDAQGRLTRETYPEGQLFTYTSGILATVSAGGFLYTYSSQTAADGSVTATLAQAQAPAGDQFTFTDGKVTGIQWADGSVISGLEMDAQGRLTAGTILQPDGTRQMILNGAVSTVTLPDGRSLSYDAGWLRQLNSSGVVTRYSYTFDGTGAAAGAIAAIRVTSSDGSSRIYSCAGDLQALADPDGTLWTVSSGWITQATASNGTVTSYSRAATPFGRQIARQTLGVNDRFNFDAAGNLYAAGTDRNLSGPTPFKA